MLTERQKGDLLGPAQPGTLQGAPPQERWRKTIIFKARTAFFLKNSNFVFNRKTSTLTPTTSTYWTLSSTSVPRTLIRLVMRSGQCSTWTRGWQRYQPPRRRGGTPSCSTTTGERGFFKLGYKCWVIFSGELVEFLNKNSLPNWKIGQKTVFPLKKI